jgi:hypothetical protein
MLVTLVAETDPRGGDKLDVLISETNIFGLVPFRNEVEGPTVLKPGGNDRELKNIYGL